jgi:hypothetical protein
MLKASQPILPQDEFEKRAGRLMKQLVVADSQPHSDLQSKYSEPKSERVKGAYQKVQYDDLNRQKPKQNQTSLTEMAMDPSSASLQHSQSQMHERSIIDEKAMANGLISDIISMGQQHHNLSIGAHFNSQSKSTGHSNVVSNRQNKREGS